ncbi:MAG: MFS transporter [Citrobacter freundii]|nr:MAG: MFS transporter [Citrobacter freundii]
MKTSINSFFRVSQKLIAPILLSPARLISGGGDRSVTYTNRQIRVAVSVFFFSQGLCFSSWASRIPDIKASLGLNNAALGSILLALPAGQLTAMPFSGRLVTHFGSKNVLRLCLLIYAVGLTNMGLAAHPWQLALALYLFGICGNMCNISVNTQAIATEQLYGRSIMTSFHGAWSSAGVAGAAIGLLMMKWHISPYLHFWIIAGLVFLAVAFSQRYLQPGRSTIKQEKKKFFSKPNSVLVQLGIIAFCCMASEGAMFEWSGVYFQQVVKAPEALIILGYLSFMTMMATGRFIGDKLIARYGRKRMLKTSGILISTGLFISVLFPYIITATLGFLIVGLGVSSVVPMIYSAAGKVPNVPPGIALASVSSISFFGFLMGPPVIGYIAQISSLRYSFAVIGLLGFGIAILVSRLKAVQ